MFVRKTSKCALKKKNLRSKTLSHKWLAAVTTHKGWVTGASLSKICSDTLPAHRKTHIKSSFQTQKHNFSVSQSVWSKTFWLKHTSSSHLLCPFTCHFIRFFSCSHYFSSSYPRLSPSPPVLDPICCSSCLYMSLHHCSALTQKRSF